MREVQVGDLVRTFHPQEAWDDEKREEYVLDPGVYRVKRVIHHVVLDEWDIRIDEGGYAIVSEREQEVIEPTVTVPRDDLRKVLFYFNLQHTMWAAHDEANRLQTLVEST